MWLSVSNIIEMIFSLLLVIVILNVIGFVLYIRKTNKNIETVISVSDAIIASNDLKDYVRYVNQHIKEATKQYKGYTIISVEPDVIDLLVELYNNAGFICKRFGSSFILIRWTNNNDSEILNDLGKDTNS